MTKALAARLLELNERLPRPTSSAGLTSDQYASIQSIYQFCLENLPAILSALKGVEEMREALKKLAGFDHSTEEKIKIARAALRSTP